MADLDLEHNVLVNLFLVNVQKKLHKTVLIESSIYLCRQSVSDSLRDKILIIKQIAFTHWSKKVFLAH